MLITIAKKTYVNKLKKNISKDTLIMQDSKQMDNSDLFKKMIETSSHFLQWF